MVWVFYVLGMIAGLAMGYAYAVRTHRRKLLAFCHFEAAALIAPRRAGRR